MNPTEQVSLGPRLTSASRLAFALAAAALTLTAFLIAASSSAARTYDSQITGFTTPWGLAVDSEDNLWASDTGNGLISEYSPYPSQVKVGEQDGGGIFTSLKAIACIALPSTTPPGIST